MPKIDPISWSTHKCIDGVPLFHTCFCPLQEAGLYPLDRELKLLLIHSPQQEVIYNPLFTSLVILALVRKAPFYWHHVFILLLVPTLNAALIPSDTCSVLLIAATPPKAHLLLVCAASCWKQLTRSPQRGRAVSSSTPETER